VGECFALAEHGGIESETHRQGSFLDFRSGDARIALAQSHKKKRVNIKQQTSKGKKKSGEAALFFIRTPRVMTSPDSTSVTLGRDRRGVGGCGGLCPPSQDAGSVPGIDRMNLENE